MIDYKEHIYSDNPNIGHPDVRTDLKGASYFFLGNGKILAAVQYAPLSNGSPIGLLIMDPNQLHPKRESLTMDQSIGLEGTKINIFLDGSQEVLPGTEYKANWENIKNIPCVKVEWKAGPMLVSEYFYCITMERPEVIRKVIIRNLTVDNYDIEIKTGTKNEFICIGLSIDSLSKNSFTIKYNFDSSSQKVDFESNISASSSRCAIWVPESNAHTYWNSVNSIDFNDGMLNHCFNASKNQIFSVVSDSGVVDASIWQYNREWVRDHSMMVVGLLLAGHHHKAGILLSRLLDDFVTDQGDTIDSSEIRTSDEVELDQNGVLLHVVKEYVLWTGDWELVKTRWDKIIATADFLFRDEFQHKSGLLKNCREYWERHKIHGIKEGFELTYQLFPILGLEAASFLASRMGDEPLSERWKSKSDSIRKGFLEDPDFSFIKDGVLVKRLDVYGNIEKSITPETNIGLPDAVPLAQELEHILNPDTSAVLPIVYGLIPGYSEVAQNTVHSMGKLWNQVWDAGGYGRYHYSSEPDSAGAWPFASLFVVRAIHSSEKVVVRSEKNGESGEWRGGDGVMRVLDWLNTVPGAESGIWFEFYGDRISPPYAQVGIPPWTWAEMLQLMVYQILGIKVEEDYFLINPKFIGDIDSIRIKLLIRRKRFNFELKRGGEQNSVTYENEEHIIDNDGFKVFLK